MTSTWKVNLVNIETGHSKTYPHSNLRSAMIRANALKELYGNDAEYEISDNTVTVFVK